MVINRVAAFVVAILASATLSACQGDSPENPAAEDTHTRDYRGGTVTCYQASSGESRMGTCDFDTFYEANPELLFDSEEKAAEGVFWMEIDSHPLACIHIGSSTSQFMGCDWPRYKANYKTAK